MNSITAPDKQQFGARAARDGAEKIRAAIRRSGRANVIVATGASQFEMLAHLVNEPDVAWDRVTAFHLDEYVGLPVTHPASFRKYLWERFHRLLPLPLAAFHYIEGDAADPHAEARRVGEILGRHPIDVAFVGIGENGHLAFNDPPADFETQDPYLVVTLDEGCRRQQLGEGWFPIARRRTEARGLDVVSADPEVGGNPVQRPGRAEGEGRRGERAGSGDQRGAREHPAGARGDDRLPRSRVGIVALTAPGVYPVRPGGTNAPASPRHTSPVPPAALRRRIIS